MTPNIAFPGSEQFTGRTAWLAACLVMCLTAFPSLIHAQTDVGSDRSSKRNVYVIEVTGEVDLGLGPYVQRVITEAGEDPTAVVLLHVNTFGGRVDVATEIKDAVINAGVPTVAFVDKRAISAGALITLSADKIAMAPGGSIGAATPVSGGTGEKASEKVVSYMRGEMRATAERTGRNPKIAEAMVDEDIALDDSAISTEGKLVTLTTDEALRVGFCDAEATTIEEALAAFGYGDVNLVQTDINWSESLVRILTSPLINSLLIMLGLGGLFYTIKTGHIGWIAGVGVTSIVLFFSSQYLVSLANAIEILLFGLGVILLLVEIFVIPGFGIAGVSGILLMVGSLFMALVGSFDLFSMSAMTTPLSTLAGAFVGLAILAWLMIKYLPTSTAFNKFMLNSESLASGMDPVEQERARALVGLQGSALTTLRPAGIAMFGEGRIDVVSEGEFIRAGEPVTVVKVEGRKVVVRKGAIDNLYAHEA